MSGSTICQISSEASVPSSAFHHANTAQPSDKEMASLDKPSSSIVLAGTGFRAVQDYIRQAIPDIRFEMIDPATLRSDGHDAQMLIPAMARVDAVLMDRIRGLRLIHQWGAGLEGVDIDAASGRRIFVANVPSTGGNADSV